MVKIFKVNGKIFSYFVYIDKQTDIKTSPFFIFFHQNLKFLFRNHLNFPTKKHISGLFETLSRKPFLKIFAEIVNTFLKTRIKKKLLPGIILTSPGSSTLHILHKMFFHRKDRS